MSLHPARARGVVTAGVAAAALALAAAVAAGEEADEDADEADDAVHYGGDDAADAADDGHDGAAYGAEGVTDLLGEGRRNVSRCGVLKSVKLREARCGCVRLTQEKTAPIVDGLACVWFWLRVV